MNAISMLPTFISLIVQINSFRHCLDNFHVSHTFWKPVGVDFSLASTWHNCLDICYFNLFGSAHTDLAGARSQKNNFNSFNFRVWDHQTLGKNHSAYLFFVEIPPISHRWATICWVPSWNCQKKSLPQLQLHPESWQQTLIFDSWNMWQKNLPWYITVGTWTQTSPKKNSLCVPESTRMSEVPSTWTKQKKTHNKQKHSNNVCLLSNLQQNQNAKRDVFVSDSPGGSSMEWPHRFHPRFPERLAEHVEKTHSLQATKWHRSPACSSSSALAPLDKSVSNLSANAKKSLLLQWQCSQNSEDDKTPATLW